MTSIEKLFILDCNQSLGLLISLRVNHSTNTNVRNLTPKSD